MTTAEQPPPGKGESTGSLTKSTTSGFAWLTGSFLLDRVSTFGVQVALTYLLLEEQIGLWALVPTIVTLFMQVLVSPMRDLLLHRQKKFHLWVRQAFWLLGTMGIVAALLCVVAAFVATALYDKPGLLPVMLVCSIQPIFFAMWTIPYSSLSKDLRFKAISFISITSAVARWIVTLILAIVLPEGLGAMAFAVGLLWGDLQKVVCGWWLTQIRIDPRPRLSRWKYFTRDYSAMSVAYLSVWTKNLGDRMVLGFGLTDAVMAVYFVALQVAMQGYVILSGQVGGVLLPALGKLTDNPTRQREAFLRAMRVTHFIGIPSCVGLAAIADPLVNILYDEQKYRGLGLILAGVALVVSMRLADSPARALMSAQGRFTQLSRLDFVSAVGFFVAVFAGMTAGAAYSTDDLAPLVGAIIAEIVFHFGWNLYMIRTAIKPTGGTMRDVAGVFTYSIVASVVMIGAAWVLGGLIPGKGLTTDIVRLVVVVFAGVVLFTACALIVRPRELRDLLDTADRILPARIGGRVRTLRAKLPGLE